MKNPKKTPHPGKSTFYSHFLYAIGKFLYPLRFQVQLNFDPQQPLKLQGPVLILSKHCSNHDIVAGYRLVVDRIGRHPWCMIKDNLVKPYFFGFFLKIGGIPINRKNPEKSKEQLLMAKKILAEGNALVLFPEQSRFMGRMGEAKVGGFRFITGKPKIPITVLCAGLSYRKGFFRNTLQVKFGNPKSYSRQNNPEQFLYECMQEIAQLSDLAYDFPVP